VATPPPAPVHTAPPAVAPVHKTTPAPTHVASKPAAETKPTPPPADTKPAKAADSGGGGGCDEVSCVLSNYDGACCAKFKKKGGGGGAQAAAAGGGDLPDALDRSMISDGVAKVKARVMSCGDKSSAKGQVKVSVKVDPSGKVTSVTVKNTPDPGLGDCVASQMQKATFAKTQTGGSFSYPYTF
jgi:TonB family protein